MLTWCLVILRLVFAPPAEHRVAGLQATAPAYLTRDRARLHLVAAEAAGTVHHVPPDVALSVAFHESRYVPSTRTAESGGRVSCGVMTPAPRPRCSAAELTIVGGYDAGAAHLHEWLERCGGRMRCALLGYAGGFALVRACGDRVDGVCRFPNVVLERAAWIRAMTR